MPSAILLASAATRLSVRGPVRAYLCVKPKSGWVDTAPTATLYDNTGAYGNGGVAISGNPVVAFEGCCDDSGFSYPAPVDVFVRPANGWGNFSSTQCRADWNRRD